MEIFPALDSSNRPSEGASHALLADSGEGVLPKIGRELELALMIPVGAVTDGISHIANHPLQFAGEVAGSAGLALACRGPAWLRAPATAFALLGTVDFGVHVFDAAAKSAPYFGDAWRSGQNMDTNLSAVRTNLGPLAFNFAVMGLVGKGTNRLAVKFQNATPADLSFALKNRAGYLSDSVAQSIGLQNDLALAGGGRLAAMERAPDIFDSPGSAKPEVMQMVATNSERGGGGGSDNFTRMRRTASGDTIYDFKNVFDRTLLGNEFPHPDGTTSLFGYKGDIKITFPDGQSRSIDLQRPINHVSILEKSSGEKEFRFNGNTKEPDLTTEPKRHTFRAVLPNKDSLLIMDTNSGLRIAHTDGLTTTVNPNGKVEFTLKGLARTIDMERPISRVISLKHPDGNRTFSFEDATGKLHPNPIDVPKVVQPLRQTMPVEPPRKPLVPPLKQPVQPLKQILQPPPVVPPPTEAPGGIRISPPNDNLMQGWATGRDNLPGADPGTGARQMGMPVNHGIHRAIVEGVLGIDPEMAARNGMRSPGDVGLALQGHEQWVYDYLVRLGTGRGAI